MFSVLLVLSAYEEKVNYERSFWICKNYNGTYGLTNYDEKRAPLDFETLEEARTAVECFRGLDFGYASIEHTEKGFIMGITQLRTTK